MKHIKERIYMEIKGELISSLGLMTIFLDVPGTGHIRDGRRVILSNERWIYRPM